MMPVVLRIPKSFSTGLSSPLQPCSGLFITIWCFPAVPLSVLIISVLPEKLTLTLAPENKHLAQAKLSRIFLSPQPCAWSKQSMWLPLLQLEGILGILLPGEGNGNPPVFLPGESHGQRTLVGCGPWGPKESDTTKQLHFTSLRHLTRTSVTTFSLFWVV